MRDRPLGVKVDAESRRRVMADKAHQIPPPLDRTQEVGRFESG